MLKHITNVALVVELSTIVAVIAFMVSTLTTMTPIA